MAENLHDKWRRMFYFYNSDQDNALTCNDFNDVESVFLRHCSAVLPKEKVAKLRGFSDYMWSRILACSPTEVMHEKQYLQRLETIWKHPEDLRKYVAGFRGALFSCVDLDQDGQINYTEFKFIMDEMGYVDPKSLSKSFAIMDCNNDGLISKDEYVNGYLKYMSNEWLSVEDFPLYGNA